MGQTRGEGGIQTEACLSFMHSSNIDYPNIAVGTRNGVMIRKDPFPALVARYSLGIENTNNEQAIVDFERKAGFGGDSGPRKAGK